jgi:hypothetical protein
MHYCKLEDLNIGSVVGDAHYGLEKIEIGGAKVKVVKAIEVSMPDASDVLNHIMDNLLERDHSQTTNKYIYVVGEGYENDIKVMWSYDGRTLGMAVLNVVSL